MALRYFIVFNLFLTSNYNNNKHNNNALLIGIPKFLSFLSRDCPPPKY